MTSLTAIPAGTSGRKHYAAWPALFLPAKIGLSSFIGSVLGVVWPIYHATEYCGITRLLILTTKIESTECVIVAEVVARADGYIGISTIVSLYVQA